MEYESVIGLEIHARIKSKTKLFCRCSNDFFEETPNSHTCPICMGFPGTLPLPNTEAIQKGIKAAMALGCKISGFSKFDRKSYFYPDLPKGFQISQYDKPLSENGQLKIHCADGSVKIITIIRLHLEDDAGKLVHDGQGSLVDYNRCGSPLMEIVSGPDFRSPEDTVEYARQIQKIMRYLQTSDADMEKGQMRFDINVSIRHKGQQKFGVKTEVKNLNSFRSLEKAVKYEIGRQTKLLENGGTVAQETRGWDDKTETTVPQRAKEGSADYRYFPEPDIPPLVITREMVEKLKKEIPELPAEKTERYEKKFGLSWSAAGQLTDSAYLADYFEKAVAVSGEPKLTANWILTELIGILNRKGLTIRESNLAPENLGSMIRMISSGEITGKIAKEIFEELYGNNADPEKLISKKGIRVISDNKKLEEICAKVIEQNPQIAADFRAGKEKALSALVGQVMAETQGKANPKVTNESLRKLLTDNFFRPHEGESL